MRHLGAALVILTSTTAFAGNTPDYSALDVHALLDSITDAQRAEFHIAIATWKESAPATQTPQVVAIPFPHAYILGSLEGVAAYDAGGNLITDGLTILPTTYLIRMPAKWNGRLLFTIAVGGGIADHRLFGANLVELLKQGYAIAVICHALPDNPGFPYEQFIGVFGTHDLGASIFSISHMVKALLGQAFAKPLATYMLAFSGGTLFGSGLIVGRHGNPIDGYIMGTGGNGRRLVTEQQILVLGGLVLGSENLIPLTGQLVTVPDPVTFPFVYKQATTDIGLSDPEYRALMLSKILSGDLLGAEELFFDYKVETRPADVQHAWDDLRYDPDIQTPVIVLQGTADTAQYVRNALVFAQAVIAAGHSDMLRLYIVKDQVHMPWPTDGVVDAVNRMARWVEEGIPPEAPTDPSDVTTKGIKFGAQTVLNNWGAEFPNDPCGYFHSQFDPLVQPPANCGL